MGDGDRLIEANAVYQFFPAQADGNDVGLRSGRPRRAGAIVISASAKRTASLSGRLPAARGQRRDGLGRAVHRHGRRGVRARAETWKDAGDYLRAHALQALALELAEALAERLHHVLRDTWGFPDPPEMTMRERFIARYQGIRVSFGYPACPNLEDQAPLFRLLHPEDIGVQLTDGFMMEPEASVSALVFAHPEARYFNVEA